MTFKGQSYKLPLCAVTIKALREEEAKLRSNLNPQEALKMKKWVLGHTRRLGTYTHALFVDNSGTWSLIKTGGRGGRRRRP